MRPNWRKNYLRYKSYFLNVVANYEKRGEIKAYLELVLSLLTISIFSVFALRPTLLTIGSLIKQIQAKEEVMTQLDQKIDQLNQSHAIYNNNKDNILLLGEAIPANAQPEVLARQMEALTAKYQIADVNMTMEQVILKGQDTQSNTVARGKEVLPEGAKGYSFVLSLEAPIENYSLLADFMKDFQNLRSPIKFSNISLSSNFTSPENSTESGRITIAGQQKILVLDMIIKGEAPYLPKN
ncbi:hypothetical protein A2115_02335 [Candidatus Woesebacteria bacterium GWA1_41_8]|uniref:Uncharacterized protein n=1 Tax=Candidatus Woesebacteria bacterium GWA1_41_8 TaxID=1802471 RepID=A0A1F7WL01_9BACT|nr:MAG: hypothetical protein A2115_02335 [Candidatus Woesebacteria bacterium GWA1_41_8]